MTNRPPTIEGLQRAARLHHAREEAHFQLLRAGEALRDRGPGLRRALASIAVAVVVVVVVASATAVAGRRDDATEHRTGVRTAPPAAGGTRADETLIGTGVDDRLDGRGGDDVLVGGDGADVLFGSRGDDVLLGGDGDDVLWAGPGRDVLVGAEGDDVLRASDVDGRPDRLHCGPGNDIAYVVRIDGRIQDRTVACERVVVVDVRRARPTR